MARCPRVTFSDSDSESDSDEEGLELCATFDGGVPSSSVDRLEGVRSLLGLRGGLMLDTGVIAHWSCETPPQLTEVVVRVGQPGRGLSAFGAPPKAASALGAPPKAASALGAPPKAAITLADVQDALESIPIDAFQPGRSYVWEGITVSLGGETAFVQWGS